MENMVLVRWILTRSCQFWDADSDLLQREYYVFVSIREKNFNKTN